MKPFIERVDGEILNEYLCKYYGSDHGDFVSALLDLVINEKNSKLQHQLEIQTKRVENLKNFLSQGDELKVLREWIFRSDSLSRCQAIDQELEKELEGVR